MHKVFRFAALAFLGLACSLQPTSHGQAAAAAESAARHTLWSLQGKSNTVYLLGSVHFLSPSEQLPAAINAAYAESETLIMEIDMDDMDPIEMQRLTLELGMLPPDQTLAQVLGPQAYARTSAEARKLGLDPALLNRFRPWLAALTLVQLNLVKMGLDPNSGVERRLTAQAATDGKEIRGLETLQLQLGLLAGLPETMQREFLMYSIEDTERAAQEVDKLIAAWRIGDSKALADLLTEGFERYPDIYRPLTTDRNRRWIADIENLLDDRDDYLVVVGALHLVGKDSVVELLERNGHKVRQH
jgi:uncharacterized protein YbaP (TraB family)